MIVTDVAKHLNLNWKTVKQIDKEFLKRDFGQPNFDGLRVLVVDEISIRKGHNYVTVVMDYISGRILIIEKHRKARTLIRSKLSLKGAKYLLLKNRNIIRRQNERQQLKQLLELNQVINTVMILKDKFKALRCFVWVTFYILPPTIKHSV